MKCCIENCRNNGKVKKLSTGSEWITFHLLPKDVKLRASWLQALSLPNSMSLNRAFICSDHFREDDFYVTKQGTRRIKYGVVPFLEGNCSVLAASRVCKLCLGLDLKMYKLEENSLAKMYEDVMGMAPRTDPHDRLPMGICWECTARLQSAAAFRSKALFSDELLQEHFKNNAELNIIDIQNLHREHTILKPTIVVQETFKFNSRNGEEHTPNTLVKSEVIGIPHNEELEIEVQDLVSDTITIKDERKNAIIEEVSPMGDVKTEIDLIPTTQFDVNDKDTRFNDNDKESEFDVNDKNTEFDDYSEDDCCIVKEDAYVSENKVSLDNIILFKSEEMGLGKMNLSSNINLVQSDTNMYGDVDDNIMDLNDEVSNINDNEDESTKVAIKKVVPQKKKREVKKKKVAVKKKVKTDDDVIIWVKGKRPRSPKPQYVKPSIPIDENIFTIKSLNHDDLRREILARKDGKQYLLAPFKCDVCFKGFPTEDKQARHVIKHSEQCGAIKCTICNVRMAKARDMRAHMKRQHTSEFICKLCPMVTRNRNVALGHMKYHEGSKFECPQCSLEFEKKTTLLNHLRLKHMSACVCELCGYTFVSKTGVVVHKRMRHKLFDKNTEFKGQYCEVCEVKFLNQKAYNRHLRLSSKHIKEDDPNRMSNDPSIKQRRIGSACMRARGVRRPTIHRKDAGVPANGVVTCEQCGVVVESIRAYSAHFKYSHPGINRTQFSQTTNPYMCEHCGKFFLNTTTLTCHMWVHTGQKRFQCDHCNKSFSMKSNLANHMQQHQSVRRMYDCRVCGKHFTFSYNLTRHMFLHTGLRPFKCDACEKTFRTSGELRAHVDHVHLKKPRPKRVRRKTKKCEISSLEY